MPRRTLPLIRWLALLCTIVVLGTSVAADAGFIVIKNAKNPTAKLSRDELKKVFNGHTKTWANGEAIILVIGSEDSPAMKWLAETIFGASAKTFLAKLKQDVFKGDVTHPQSADDDARTLKRVQAGTGLVGLVTEATAKTLPADLGVIAVP